MITRASRFNAKHNPPRPRPRQSELIVERVRLEGKRYQLLEIYSGWKGYFPTMQAVQDHIEMWFAGYLVEWRIDNAS